MITVICQVGNKKLLKGMSYQADYINTNLNGNKWIKPGTRFNRINIIGVGEYSTNGFRLTTGEKIPIDTFMDQRPIRKSTIKEEVRPGDWVTCLSNDFKDLIPGSNYQVEDVIFISVGTGQYSRAKIKIKGSKRYIFFNYKFKLTPINEVRDLSLNTLLDNENSINGKVGEIADLDKLMLEIIAKSILDKNRHQLGIIDWGLDKYGKCGLTKEDFNDFLQKKIQDVLID